MRLSLKPILIIALFAVSTAAHAQYATPQDRAFVAKVSQGGHVRGCCGAYGDEQRLDTGHYRFCYRRGTRPYAGRFQTGAHRGQSGITIQPKLNAQFTAKLKYLSSLSGPAFDRAYLSEMATLHDMDGAAFAKEAVRGGSPDFKAFGAETHRIVLRHIGAIQAVPAR
jgi:putative membrane protein